MVTLGVIFLEQQVTFESPHYFISFMYDEYFLGASQSVNSFIIIIFFLLAPTPTAWVVFQRKAATLLAPEPTLVPLIDYRGPNVKSPEPEVMTEDFTAPGCLCWC